MVMNEKLLFVVRNQQQNIDSSQILLEIFLESIIVDFKTAIAYTLSWDHTDHNEIYF